jgi:signal transduction histidine kinase
MIKRIFLGFGLLLFIFLAGSLSAVLLITKTAERMDKLIMLHQIEILREDLIIHVQQVQASLQRGGIRSPEDVDELMTQLREMDRVINSCIGCHHESELTRNIAAMHELGGHYKDEIKLLIAASRNAGRAEKLERGALELGRQLIVVTQGMAFNANERLQQKTQETIKAIREVKIILYITLLIGFVLAIIAAFILASGLDNRLRKLLDATRRISHGELRQRVDIDEPRGSEFRELGESFNLMTQNLELSQRQLIQSAKFAAIGELATNIANEVNNPLTGVLGYTGLLLKAGDIPDKRKEQLRTIERETLRAREILKNLLDFSRKKPARFARAELRDLVQDTLALVKGQAKLIGVEFEVNCPDGLPAVSVDADEIKQVFVNLINNAFFSMPKGGKLTITCGIDKDVLGKTIAVVEFADTGFGIPEDNLDKIFDPFFTTQPEGEGTGLGLSISYMVVQNHGGRIEVESKVGKGTVFRVFLSV